MLKCAVVLRMGCGVLALLAGVTPLRAQGVLERMRLATHEGPHLPSPPARTDSSSSSNAAVGLGAGAADAMPYAFLGAAIVATSPFWGPHFLLGDTLEVPGYFPAAPYALDWAGYMNIDYDGLHTINDQKAQFGDLDYQKNWAGRLSLEDGNDFNGLNRLDGEVFLDTSSRLGLRSHWSDFQENVAGHIDESLLGDTELTYRFVQREWLQMHTGLGVRLLSDRSDTRVGFNFFYGADVYPVAPLVVSSSFDLGNLDAAFVVHGRLTMGAVWRRWELLAGYDFLRVGSVNLQGPLLGLRLWF